ncbi:response regulator [Methylobacterium oxalidis]|uniref:response regulator n=1 Tax=Methylobacterium oxalidis TaxID=944322 RepID=UPI0033154616
MSEPASALDGTRILLVEDEYLIAIEVARWLRTAGATVVGPVPSVDQALDLIADDGIDAAVLDVNLGDGDRVYPVADRLNALGVPYLFATGDVKVSDVAVYRERPRLEKPFGEVEVVRALAKLLS